MIKIMPMNGFSSPINPNQQVKYKMGGGELGLKKIMWMKGVTTKWYPALTSKILFDTSSLSFADNRLSTDRMNKCNLLVTQWHGVHRIIDVEQKRDIDLNC